MKKYDDLVRNALNTKRVINTMELIRKIESEVLEKEKLLELDILNSKIALVDLHFTDEEYIEKTLAFIYKKMTFKYSEAIEKKYVNDYIDVEFLKSYFMSYGYHIMLDDIQKEMQMSGYPLYGYDQYDEPTYDTVNLIQFSIIPATIKEKNE